MRGLVLLVVWNSSNNDFFRVNKQSRIMQDTGSIRIPWQFPYFLAPRL
jgi:hypothetical protein